MQSQYLVIGAAIVVLIVLLAIAWWYSRKRREEQLRERFGPEYDRVASERGRSGAADELQSRSERVQQLDIRPLSDGERNRFGERWRQVQAAFVDHPTGAVRDADALVAEVMQARGYPMSDFDQRAADVSVNHPRVVEHYRTAHDIAERDAAGQATTEDLRQAMVHYRALFDDLLGTERSEPNRASQAAQAGQPR